MRPVGQDARPAAPSSAIMRHLRPDLPGSETGRPETGRPETGRSSGPGRRQHTQRPVADHGRPPALTTADQAADLTDIGNPPLIRRDSIGSGTTLCDAGLTSRSSRLTMAITNTASIMPRWLPTQNRGPAPNGR